MIQTKGKTQASEEEVERILPFLNENEQGLRTKALAEGYKDEKCGECKGVFLAHKHFIRCEHPSCPMISRKPDGTPEPSFLDKLIEQTYKESP